MDSTHSICIIGLVSFPLLNRTKLIPCVVTSKVLGVSATLTISYITLNVIADADHLTCHLRTRRIAGQFSLVSDQSAVVVWGIGSRIDSELLVVLCPFPAASGPRTADALPSSNTGWACQLYQRARSHRRCICLPTLRGVLASISNLSATSTTLSKNAFHTFGSAFSCCNLAIVVVACLHWMDEVRGSRLCSMVSSVMMKSTFVMENK